MSHNRIRDKLILDKILHRDHQNNELFTEELNKRLGGNLSIAKRDNFS